jgi:hypothetical protein
MKELTDSIVKQSSPNPAKGVEVYELREAAKKWACYAIDIYSDAFLTRALSISKSIAEFCTVIEKDEPHE